MSLRSDMQQNIQIELNFSPAPAGEACEAGREETESLPAMSDPQSPSSTNRLMEEVCERENLKEALQRVKANKGSAGIDGMTVGGIADYPLDRGDPLAVRRVLERDLNPVVGRRDLLVQLGQLLVEALEQHPARNCQLSFGIFQHRRQSSADLPRVLRQHDPVLGQQPTDLVDELRAALMSGDDLSRNMQWEMRDCMAVLLPEQILTPIFEQLKEGETIEALLMQYTGDKALASSLLPSARLMNSASFEQELRAWLM